MTTATATPHCDARVGFYPGEFSEMPLACSVTVGLDTWTDTTGRTRHGCRWHRATLRYRYPTPEQARVALAIERISADFTAELDEDEPRDFDREGQPEWNGSFR